MPESNPAIVAPVFRELPVTDPARSGAFYRDILGFEVAEHGSADGSGAVVDARLGPARLVFVAGDRTATPHTVFFETNDVVALRDSIAARGGAPSSIDRVNWIRMRAFQLRDPDEHVLWFGQSLHTPLRNVHTPPGHGQLRQIMPAMPHRDVAAGIAHYRDVFGFTVNYAQANLGVMDRDSVRVLIVGRAADREVTGSCYVYVEDADALHAELVAKGAHVEGPPVTHPWGLRDFWVHDLEGNEITFGQTFE